MLDERKVENVAIWEVRIAEDDRINPETVCGGFLQQPKDKPRIFFAGESLLTNWQPLPIEWESGDAADFIPMNPGVVACSVHAWSIIRPFVESEVEVLPVNWPKNVDYILFHVINLVDAVDYEKTTWQNSRRTRADRIYFREELVKDSYLFKIPINPATITYATDAFKALIESHNLTGMGFRKSDTSHDPTNYI